MKKERSMFRSRRRSFGPFLLGLLIGGALSVGLRYLSNPCWRKGLSYDNFLDTLPPNIKSGDYFDVNNIKTDELNDGNEENDLNERQNLNQNEQQQLNLINLFDENKVIQSSRKGQLQPQQQDQNENLDELLPLNSVPFSMQDPDVDSRNILINFSTSKSTVNSVKKSPWKTSQKNLLLVGVMTAQKYLDNRALGVFETWAQEIPGKVIFFTGASSFNNSNSYRNRSSDFMLVPLEGVDDSYPPQKKSFRMIQYMYDNYGDDYEWFMRADDDVYVKADKLAEFLRSINSRQLYFIGQAGKGNDAEKGTLNLAHNENFCMGGPGIILSRVALAKVAPFVEHCLQEMYSTHEDVEIGRCVQRFAGISCTWAYEMQSIFYHNSSGEDAFTDNLKRREVHQAITLHPVKDYRHMYRLHSYVKTLAVQQLIHESLLVQRELLALPSESLSPQSDSKEFSVHLKGNLTVGTEEPDDMNIYGLPPSLNKFQPTEENDIIEWKFLGSTGSYSDTNLSPKQKMESPLKEAVEDVVREMMDLINGYSRVRGRIIDFKEILYGYHRINPLYGQDFILDLLMTYKKYRGKKMTVPVRRHAYIQRSFSPLQLRFIPEHVNDDNTVSKDNQILQSPSPSPYFQKPIVPSMKIPLESEKPEESKFVMILPLSGRLTAFERFLKSYQETCNVWSLEMEKRGSKKNSTHPLTLIIVYFSLSDETENQNKFYSIVNSFRLQRSKNQNKIQENVKNMHCNIQVIQSSEKEFSRSIALDTGISQCNENDLLVLIDVDIRFDIDALRRVLLNTVQGKQIYFPVVFSQYNPDLLRLNLQKDYDEMDVSEDTGYWRSYGFGITAFYKSDYRLAGGFDTSIKGWGKEDVSLYDRFITNTSLSIFRAPDPHLVHIYHEFHCNPESLSRSQYTMCLGSEANSLGSSKNLMKHIFQHRPGPVGHLKRFLEQAASTMSSTSI